MLIVAGLSLKNLKPRVWDPTSPYHLENLKAVMVSYAEFHQLKRCRREAMRQGLRSFLGVPEEVRVYLDNGAFYFARQESHACFDEYEEFVEASKPDWSPIPQDYIPAPQMSCQMQRGCYDKTMRVNLKYQHNGYVPVVHIGKHLKTFTEAVLADEQLSQKQSIALGGIVPNLLRAPHAMSYTDILAGLRHTRTAFADKTIHVFGLGGTATMHIGALLGFDSADSSGWRNRAARGIVQLPGSGDRVIADLGKWRGRVPSKQEFGQLARCKCPACAVHGVNGLKASKLHGFCNRATHNLWVLLREAEWLSKHIPGQTYNANYRRRLDNTTYLPIIKELIGLMKNR